MIYAPVGLGKSMLTTTLAIAIAGGGKVLGWECPIPRKVIYYDAEMNIQEAVSRIELLEGTIDGLDTAAARRNLIVGSRNDQPHTVHFPNIADPKGQELIMEDIKNNHAELIIIDNYGTMAEVADENDASSFGPVLQFLLRLKQAGVACILVHHAGKQGDTYRGSSRIATTFEVIIGLRRLSGHLPTDGVGFELHWDKYRRKVTASTQHAECRLKTAAETGIAFWDTKAGADAEIQAVLDAVRSCRYTSQSELAEALDLSQVVVSRRKAAAIASQQISREEWNTCLQVARDANTPENSDF